jgi:hypothetical protein
MAPQGAILFLRDGQCAELFSPLPFWERVAGDPSPASLGHPHKGQGNR